MDKRRAIVASILCALLGAGLAAQQLAPVDPNDPHLEKALQLRGQALAAKDSGEYDGAAVLARQARAELALAQSAAGTSAPGAPLALPAQYAVRAIEAGEKDCLSKIAGYPFVYGDRRRWTVLYKANKATLEHPENADLILPGEILAIPCIAGERREGAWQEGVDYPSLGRRN